MVPRIEYPVAQLRDVVPCPRADTRPYPEAPVPAPSQWHRKPLRAGDRVRLGGPTDPVVEVVRVTPAAAYVRSVVVRTITKSSGYVDGVEQIKSFEVHSVHVDAISRNAQVWCE